MTADETAFANKAIVADFLTTFSRGDVAGVLQRMADDATWWAAFTEWSQRISGYQQFRGKLRESAQTLAACFRFDAEFVFEHAA